MKVKGVGKVLVAENDAFKGFLPGMYFLLNIFTGKKCSVHLYIYATIIKTIFCPPQQKMIDQENCRR